MLLFVQYLNIKLMFYFLHTGTLLLAASQANNSDLLWSVGPDSFPFQNQLMETHVSQQWET